MLAPGCVVVVVGIRSGWLGRGAWAWLVEGEGVGIPRPRMGSSLFQRKTPVVDPIYNDVHRVAAVRERDDDEERERKRRGAVEKPRESWPPLTAVRGSEHAGPISERARSGHGRLATPFVSTAHPRSVDSRLSWTGQLSARNRTTASTNTAHPPSQLSTPGLRHPRPLPRIPLARSASENGAHQAYRSRSTAVQPSPPILSILSAYVTVHHTRQIIDVATTPRPALHSGFRIPSPSPRLRNLNSLTPLSVSAPSCNSFFFRLLLTTFQ